MAGCDDVRVCARTVLFARTAKCLNARSADRPHVNDTVLCKDARGVDCFGLNVDFGRLHSEERCTYTHRPIAIRLGEFSQVGQQQIDRHWGGVRWLDHAQDIQLSFGRVNSICIKGVRPPFRAGMNDNGGWDGDVQRTGDQQVARPSTGGGSDDLGRKHLSPDLSPEESRVFSFDIRLWWVLGQ